MRNRLLSVIHQHPESPALHAGIIAVTLILTSLFNIGIFLLLLLCTLLLDAAWFALHAHQRIDRAMMAALRVNLQSIALVCSAVAVSATVLEGVTRMTGVPQSLTLSGITIVRAIVTVAAKWKILTDFSFTLVTFWTRKRSQASWRTWSWADAICGGLVLASAVVLIVAPFTTGLDQQELLQTLRWELIPRIG